MWSQMYKSYHINASNMKIQVFSYFEVSPNLNNSAVTSTNDSEQMKSQRILKMIITIINEIKESTAE